MYWTQTKTNGVWHSTGTFHFEPTREWYTFAPFFLSLARDWNNWELNLDFFLWIVEFWFPWEIQINDFMRHDPQPIATIWGEHCI